MMIKDWDWALLEIKYWNCLAANNKLTSDGRFHGLIFSKAIFEKV